LTQSGGIGSGTPTTNPFFVIANDGNLLPAPVQVTSVRIGVAERVDIIIDFSPFAGTSVFLENRLNQINGQGPVIAQECGVPEIRAPGQGKMLLRFEVGPGPVIDGSADPNTQTFFALPDATATPRITRTFKFDRLNGQWSINGQFMDCNDIRLRIKQNSVEHWLLTNATGDWTHPVHIHEEDHPILTRNPQPLTLPFAHSR